MALQSYTLTMNDATPPGGSKTALDAVKHLVKTSGRYDLVVDAVNDDWTDNGAYAALNEAQNLLDELCDHPKRAAWYYAALEAGDNIVKFRFKRLIREVWVSTSSVKKFLTMAPLEDLRLHYATPADQITQGVPKWWTPVPLGLAADQKDETASSFEDDGMVDYGHVEFGNHHLYQGIMIFPPPDKAYTCEVLAEWYTAELENPADVTFWTANHLELLVKTARYCLEADMRNTSGQRDFMDEYILPRLERIQDADRLEQASKHYSQLEVQG